MQEPLLADAEQAEDATGALPTLMYARVPPAVRPYGWPWLLAAGAGASHAGVAAGVALAWVLHGDLGFVLALLSILLGPPGVVCGLAGLGLVRRHLSGWVFLVSLLTLPLNVYFSLLVFGVIPCDFYI